MFIAAENDPDIRHAATRNKWNLDGEWFCKGASHYRYLEDADQLVDNRTSPPSESSRAHSDWLEHAAYTSTHST